MPHHKHARSIAELNFYEDRLLFPGEKPEDIIGFCFGLTGKPSDPIEKRHLNITCRRIGITPKYTDIRREVGNLLIQFWKHKNLNMTKFWINNARHSVTSSRSALKAERVDTPVTPKRVKKMSAIDVFHPEQTDPETILYYRMVEAFNPAQFNKIDIAASTSSKRKTHPKIYINDKLQKEMPLIDIVRPTLLIYTMDASFSQFAGDCVEPKSPSKRLNPYNRNMRLWFDRTVLGWYSKFDADKHVNGGEFWYNLIFEVTNNHPYFNFLKTIGSTTYAGDPGDGMGGGERFP